MSKQLFAILWVSILIHIIVCWEADFERMEIKYMDTSKLNASVRFFKYNRTHTAISAELDAMTDTGTDVMIMVKAYGLFSNKYVELPLKIKRTLCDFLKHEYSWIKSDINGNFPDHCPIKKGHYYIKDYILQVNKFPPKPWNTNNYMLDVKLNSKNKNYAWIQTYIRTTSDDEIIKG